MRSLLIKWSESVLDTPTLFQLGYGGVSAPVPEEEQADDVSSFGGDDVEEAPRRRGARTREGSPTAIPREVIEAEEKADEEEDDECMSIDEPAEESAQQKQRHATFVAQKRVLLSPRTSVSSTANAEERAARVTDSIPDGDLNMLQMPALAKPRRDQGKESAEPGSQPSQNCEWSETQDPDAVAQLSTQPELTQMSSAKKKKADAEKSSESSQKENSRQPGCSDAVSNTKKSATRAKGKPGKTSYIAELNKAREKRLREGPPQDTDGLISPATFVLQIDTLFKRSRNEPPARKRKKPRNEPFTEEEEDAIRQWVRKSGVGRWQALIDSDERLRHRDYQEIIRKYRDMVRNDAL